MNFPDYKCGVFSNLFILFQDQEADDDNSTRDPTPPLFSPLSEHFDDDEHFEDASDAEEMVRKLQKESLFWMTIGWGIIHKLRRRKSEWDLK